MNKQLTALYLEYENELKTTVPDFAHQLEQLVKVKSQPVNYDNKPVAAYEQEMYKDGISKEMLKKLTVPTYKVGDIVTATDESSPLLHYGRYWKVIEFFVDDGIHRVRVSVVGGFATKEPVIYAVRKLNSSEKRDYIKTKDEEIEVDLDDRLHPDFELNVNFLSHFETNMVLSVFEKHFPDDKMKHAEQIALLADSFSNAQLQNFMKDEMEKIDNMEEEFEAAGAKGKGPHTKEEKEWLKRSKKKIFHEFEGLERQEAEELNPHTKRATVKNEMRQYNYSKRKKSRELERRLREKEMKEALRKKEMKEAKKKQEGKSTWRKMKDVVFGESDEVEVDLDELSINEELETDIEPHCGKKKKHKEEELIMPLQHCDTCEFAHADHFRLCEHCNEEHDGCCEVLA